MAENALTAINDITLHPLLCNATTFLLSPFQCRGLRSMMLRLEGLPCCRRCWGRCMAGRGRLRAPQHTGAGTRLLETARLLCRTGTSLTRA